MDFYRVKVTEIIDGDTFEGTVSFGVFGITLEKQRFRLFGVDTPERNEPNYYEATESLAEKIENKDVTCLIHGKDSFGRWLVTVFAGDFQEPVNELLKSEGLAVDYKR